MTHRTQVLLWRALLEDHVRGAGPLHLEDARHRTAVAKRLSTAVGEDQLSG